MSRFRKAMKLDEQPTDEDCEQCVDLYRLVPVTDYSNCCLTDQEQLLVHMPGAGMSCEAIEDLYRQLEEAEVRCERSRESIMALVDALHSRAGSAGFSTARLLAPEVHEELIDRLRQEVADLRHKLEISEYCRQACEQKGQITQECQVALMREFSLLVQEVTSQRASLSSPQATSTSISPKSSSLAVPAATTWDVPAASSLLSGTGLSPVSPQVQSPQPQASGAHTPHAAPAQAAPGPVPSSSTCRGAEHAGSNLGGSSSTSRVPQLKLPPRNVQAQPVVAQYASGAGHGPSSQARLAYGGAYAAGSLTDRSSDRKTRSEARASSAAAEAANHASVGSIGTAAASAAGRASPGNARAKMAPLRLSGLRG